MNLLKLWAVQVLYVQPLLSRDCVLVDIYLKVLKQLMTHGLDCKHIVYMYIHMIAHAIL